MRLLLDTHAFLWWILDDDRLSETARQLLSEGANDIFFSVVSAWEIVVKASIGRIEVAGDPEEVIGGQVARNAFQVLPVLLRHALGVGRLPDLHRDPFDRMLVAQAIAEGLTLLSADRKVGAYEAAVLW